MGLRAAVEVIVGGVIVVLADHASVAPPILGNFSVVSETSPLEPQPRRVHADAPSDDGARLAPVPQGDELIVVERVAYLSGVDRDRRRRHVLGTQELDDLAEPQFLLACILVGLRPQRTEAALREICRQRDGSCEAQEALEAKAEGHPSRRPANNHRLCALRWAPSGGARGSASRRSGRGQNAASGGAAAGSGLKKAGA